MASLLHNSTVGEIVIDKRCLIDIPSKYTVGQALEVLLQHDIISAPVWAPPGTFLGAGGSLIVEQRGGNPIKQYIGIISVLDILIHVAEGKCIYKTPFHASVVQLIGHSNEGLSLWTLSPQTSLYEAMEPLSKGVHRILVSGEDQQSLLSSPHAGVEIVEISSKHRLLTQTDVLRFISKHGAPFEATTASVSDLGFVHHSVLSVPSTMTVGKVVLVMQKNPGISAVAVVAPPSSIGQNHPQSPKVNDPRPVPSVPQKEMGVLWHAGGRLVGNFSASDLRGCNEAVLHEFLSMSVVAVLSRLSPSGSLRPPITCRPSTSFGSAVKIALENAVHRVWITDEAENIVGVVTMSDMIGVIRRHEKEAVMGHEHSQE